MKINNNPIQTEEQFTDVVFKSTLVVAFLATMTFGANNLMINMNLYATVLFASGLVCLVFLKISPTSIWHFFCRLFFVVAFAVVITVGSYLGSLKSGLYVWLSVLPVMTYLLLSIQIGFWVSVFISLPCVVCALWFLAHDAAPIHPIASANFAVSYLLIWVMSHAFEFQRTKAIKKLKQLASTDTLTGLKNRRLLKTEFDDMVEFHIANDLDFGLAILDLDDFKQVNDLYGHDVGDEVLVKVSQYLKSHVRESDFVYRIGGEEFCVVFQQCSEQIANKVLDRVLMAIEKHVFKYKNKSFNITVSGGLVLSDGDGASFDSMFKSADQKLYQAKSEGKNQVIF